MNDKEIQHRYEAMNGAILAIEERVRKLEGWADENAERKNYSAAGSQQGNAVALHEAVALIREGVFPEYHRRPGFMPSAGDECPCCELRRWLGKQSHTEGG